MKQVLGIVDLPQMPRRKEPDENEPARGAVRWTSGLQEEAR